MNRIKETPLVIRCGRVEPPVQYEDGQSVDGSCHVGVDIIAPSEMRPGAYKSTDSTSVVPANNKHLYPNLHRMAVDHLCLESYCLVPDPTPTISALLFRSRQP